MFGGGCFVEYFLGSFLWGLGSTASLPLKLIGAPKCLWYCPELVSFTRASAVLQERAPTPSFLALVAPPLLFFDTFLGYGRLSFISLGLLGKKVPGENTHHVKLRGKMTYNKKRKD